MDASAAAGGVFNIACVSHSLHELVETLNRLLETDIETVHSSPGPGDVERSWADISLARNVLGYAPRVAFEDGLRQALGAFADDAGAPRPATIET